MNIAREAVMLALFARVATVAGLVTTGRRLVLWDKLGPKQQPALFQVEHGESYQQGGRGLPPKTTLEASLVLYARADPAALPAATLNNLLDAVEGALAPDDPVANVLTLGGLVSRCWIEGRVFKDPGDLDGQSLAVIPIGILVP
jgi:hypothetical protein